MSCEEPAFRLRRPGPEWQFAAPGLPRRAPVPWADPLHLASAFEPVEYHAKRGEWDQVVARLQELLAEAPAAQEPSGDDLAWLARRAEARRRLRELPPPGREEYERVHGEAAGRLFERAARQSEPHGFQELLERYPGSALIPRAEELLLERHLEAGDPVPALELIATRLRRPGRAPAELERLERLRELARAMQVVVPRAQLRHGEARIVVSTWAIEPGLDPRGTAAALGREQRDRVARKGGRLRASGPSRVATRPAWSFDLTGTDGTAIAQALVYRPEDGTVFLFALECPEAEVAQRAPAFRRVLKEAQL